MNTMRKILVITEHMDEKLMPVSRELISCAREISSLLPVSMHAVLLGGCADILAKTLAQTGINVTAIDMPGSGSSDPDLCWQLLEPVVRDIQPDIIMAGHTSFGIALIPLVAVRTGASCITGVKKIRQEAGSFIYTRLLCSGRFESDMRAEKNKAAVTILPGAFPAAPAVEKTGNIVRLAVSDTLSGRITLESISCPEESDFSFDDAEVIVAAGKGIGEPENLDRVKAFSILFRRAAVAGSRPLIDMGWMPYRFQVGITGKTVAPRIYIACGISGSSQHIAGMAGSEFIIAVNADPHAAIFNIADICIVEDMFPFMDAVMATETS